MKKLRFKTTKSSSHSYYTEDINRIIQVMANNGYEITEEQACQAWEKHSEDWAAGWLILPTEDCDIYLDIMSVMEGE